MEIPVRIEGWGIFLGLIAGIAVHIAVRLAEVWLARRDMKSNVLLEMKINFSKLTELAATFRDLKDAIGKKNLDAFTKYISVSSMVNVALYKFFDSSRIYRHLNSDEISKIQGFTSLFSRDVQNLFDQQIRTLREHPDAEWGYEFADTWEKSVDQQRQNLQDVNKALGGKELT